MLELRCSCVYAKEHLEPLQYSRIHVIWLAKSTGVLHHCMGRHDVGPDATLRSPNRQPSARREEETIGPSLAAIMAVQRAWRGHRTRRQVRDAAKLHSALATLELPPRLSTTELDQWLNEDGRLQALGLDSTTETLNLSYDEGHGAYVLKRTIRQ